MTEAELLICHKEKRHRRVRMTRGAIDQGLQGRTPTLGGLAKRFNPETGCLMVRRDGLKTTQRYHCSFWELDD